MNRPPRASGVVAHQPAHRFRDGTTISVLVEVVTVSVTVAVVPVSEPLLVSDYDREWPRFFERLRERLQAALGASVVAVEHVGSTAVPGLSAKPIVDLDVIVSTEAKIAGVVSALRSLGYDP